MNNEKQKEIKYFSIFTGVGGFELGLQNAGCLQQEGEERVPNPNGTTPQFYTCVGMSEIDKYSNELLKNKFPETKNYGDATKINPEELPEFDLLCGGFPCQAFSIAGKRRGFNDTRGTLFFDIARIIKVKRPKNLLLENVKGLLNHNKGQTFRTIIQTLSELGYNVQWMVLNSKFFGVPQNRERVFIIGSLRGECRPEILPFKFQSNKVNRENKETRQIIQVDDVARENKHKLGDRLKEDGPTFTLNSIEQRGIIERVQPCQLVNKNRAEKPYNPNNRKMKIKVRDDETSYTIKSSTHECMIKEGNSIRKLTPLECERLQGFPDNWTEGFSDTQRYKMMGNAVTVNVIKAIVGKLM